ncbi:MAG: efflux RND transporter periplasmic adaptor subunit [Bacteroidetes bacterium]|nr:efflux RND transporter periplasmic adaptor subunit [Bacteroidota bacterium]
MATGTTGAETRGQGGGENPEPRIQNSEQPALTRTTSRGEGSRAQDSTAGTPKGTRRPHPRVLALLGIVVVAAAGWWYYTSVATPASRGIVASGTIEAEEVSIASEVAGRVVQLPAGEGDRVRAGDVLVQLDDSLPRLQLRMAPLTDRQPLELQLEKMTVRSPLDGTVGRRSIHLGEVVSPGATLMVVTQLDRAELTLYVPEGQIGRVKVGQKVEVKVDSFPGESFPGEVTFINSKTEFTPRNVQTQRDRMNLVFAVKVKIPNPDLRLKPGMPADATILSPES